MSQPWLRLYRNAVNNPKLQKLGLEAVGFWVNLLCLSDDEGNIPSSEDIAWSMRISETLAETFLVTFQRNNLIDVMEDGNMRLHDWDEYQKRSDTSTDRVRKHREKQRNSTLKEAPAIAETHETVSETVQIREDKIRTDKKKKEDSHSDETETVGLAPTDPEAPGWPKANDLHIAVNYWNEVASEVGLPKVNGLAGERPKHLAARLKEIGSLGEWFGAVNSLKTQPFLTGKNDRNWRANFDWFVKPVNFSKVIENTYERSRSNGRA